MEFPQLPHLLFTYLEIEEKKGEVADSIVSHIYFNKEIFNSVDRSATNFFKIKGDIEFMLKEFIKSSEYGAYKVITV